MIVVSSGEGASPTRERRATFGNNVRQLVRVLDVRPKDAAKRIGVPYKWLWRVAEAGISRVSNRHLFSLQKLADFFQIPSTDDFWRDGLLCWLISSSEGSRFVEKFRENLFRLYEGQIAKFREIDFKFIAMAPKHLDVSVVMPHDRLPPNPEVSTPIRTEKLNALVATGKYDALKQMDESLRRLIDEAHEREFGGGHTNDDRDRAKKSATA
jgi:hypothetical protein